MHKYSWLSRIKSDRVLLDYIRVNQIMEEDGLLDVNVLIGEVRGYMRSLFGWRKVKGEKCGDTKIRI